MTKQTRVTGARDVVKNLEIAGTRWRHAVVVGAYLEANNIMALSKRLVPVDLGVLRASGYVTNPQEQGSRTVIEMGYGGGFSGAYATVVHERLDAHHEVGQAKYLEQPVEMRTPDIARNILGIAKRVFETNGRMPKGAAPQDPDTGEQLAAARAIGKALRSLGPRKTRGGGSK